MFLYFKRSQRSTWFGARLYTLTAHIQATDAERRIIEAHGFLERLAYLDPLDHVENLERRAEAAWQAQKKLSVFNSKDVPRIYWENAKVVALSIRAYYAFRSTFKVSVGDLLAGTIIESPNLSELVQTEASITKAFDPLQRLLAHALTFEQASETVLEPDDVEDQLPPPSTWPRYSRS